MKGDAVKGDPMDADARVRLAHGAGGPAMRTLVETVFLEGVTDPEARALGDAAVLPLGEKLEGVSGLNCSVSANRNRPSMECLSLSRRSPRAPI